MHMWVIYVGRHLSRTLKKSNAPAEDRTGDPSIYSLALYHVAIKAGLYRKAVQVYDIPNQYPVAHAKHFKHNEDGHTAPGVCGNGSVPLSHSGNVVTRMGIHTHRENTARIQHEKKKQTKMSMHNKIVLSAQGHNKVDKEANSKHLCPSPSQ